MVARFCCTVAYLVGAGVVIAAAPAYSQSNLDAGKSAAQIFATTCVNCHRSAREIKRTTTSFMREHYTTGSQEAATMAAYLAGIGSDPKAIEQRRRPAMGAGQGSPADTAAAKPGEPGKPSEQAALGQNGKQSEPGKSVQSGLGPPRRPADSMEGGVPVAAGTASSAEQNPAAPPVVSGTPAPVDMEE